MTLYGLSVRIIEPIDMKKLAVSGTLHDACCGFTYPNVAAEPPMYVPSVRRSPLGPGPYLMMVVAPNMKPMIRPTARLISFGIISRLEATYCHPSWLPSWLMIVSIPL